jgi:hypothetical protein
VINVVMSSNSWCLKMMNHCVRHAGQRIRQKRCPHSDFLLVPGILHRQRVQEDRPVRAAAPQTVRVATDEAIHESKS